MSEEHIEPEVVSEPEPEPQPVELKSSLDKRLVCRHLLYDHWKHKIADSVEEAEGLIYDLLDDDDLVKYDLDATCQVVFDAIKHKAIESCESIDDLKKLIIEHHS